MRCICPWGQMKYTELLRVSIFRSMVPHARCQGANRWGALMLRSTALAHGALAVVGGVPLQLFRP